MGSIAETGYDRLRLSRLAAPILNEELNNAIDEGKT